MFTLVEVSPMTLTYIIKIMILSNLQQILAIAHYLFKNY